MSIQAVAWALEQDLPARPKLVLVSIANHADHTNGFCWLKAETIAREAACSPRAVFNFVGDLVRNGFIRKAPRKGEDGKQRANDYWIMFARDATGWIRDRAPGEPEPVDDVDETAEPPDTAEPDTTISCEPYAPRACGESASEPAADEPKNARRAVGPHAHACSRKDSDEPSKSNPEKKAGAPGWGSAPRSYRPPPIAPEVQDSLHGPDAGKPVFVWAGTRAWKAWVEHKLRTTGIHWTLTTTRIVDGERKTGWDFPALFPPEPVAPKESAEGRSATGPPLKKPA